MPDKTKTTLTCPRCGAPLHEREVMNSLSRVDNKTYICSPCGGLEASWDWSRPGQPLPGVTVDLRTGARRRGSRA